MGMFDDLVPGGRQPTDIGVLRPDDAVRVSKPGMFDDLVPSETPSKFAAPALAGRQVGPADNFNGIDFKRPIEAVRKDITSLPDEQQKQAYDAWANHFVANEQRPLKGMENAVRSFSRGTPVGSWLDELNGKTVAGLHFLTQGYLGAPEGEALAYNRARDRQFDTENPKTSMGIKVAGAVASIPAAPTAQIMNGASVVGRGVNAAVNGIGYGALYGAGEGEDPASRVIDAAKGGAVGGALGAVAAPVATGVANAAKYAADALRPMAPALQQFSGGAVKRVAELGARDRLWPSNGGPPNPGHPQSYPAQAAELGNEGMLADMGINMRRATQGLVTHGQEELSTALQQRKFGVPGTPDRGSRTRVEEDTSAVLGQPQNLVELERNVLAQSRAQARPLYDQFYNTRISAADMRQLVPILHRVPTSAWTRAQELAGMDGVNLAQEINSGRGLDLIKRGVDDIANRARPTPLNNGDANLHRAASGLSEELRTAVDTILSPRDPTRSIWAQARNVAGDGLQFREALQQGQDAFSKGTHPDQMAADLARMNPVQQAAYGIGARGQVRDIMGQSGTMHGPNGDVAAMKALGNDQAREKLGHVFNQTRQPGQAPPEQLLNRLNAESRFEQTRVAADSGTQTAAREAGKKMFPGTDAYNEAASDAGKKGVSGLATEGAYRFANALLGGALGARREAIARDAAHMMAAQGATRDQIAHGLATFAQSRGLTTQGRNAADDGLNMLMNAPRNALIDATASRD